MSLLDFSPRIPLGTFSILLITLPTAEFEAFRICVKSLPKSNPGLGMTIQIDTTTDKNIWNSWQTAWDGVAIKYVDDEDQIGPQCMPRGKGGVATMWTKKLDSHINILPDGNQRVLITEVGNQICIINVYMPTRGTGDSEMEFDGCLAELEEITAKYGNWTNMSIAGDMNASLHRQKVLRRDQHFQNVVTRCGYKLANNYPESPTFEHHNGSKSQIDYILAIVPQKIIKVEISKREPLNTSTHKAISATILADLQTASSTTEGKAVGKIKWDKIDKDDYSERVTRKLQNIPNDKQKDSKTLLQEISTVLTQAADTNWPTTTQNLLHLNTITAQSHRSTIFLPSFLKKS